MSNIGQKIAEATDILLSKRLGNLALDQTVIGEIYECVNSAIGHYKIKYQSIIVDAYSEYPDKIYKAGDNVYIKIPSGDFSAKKMIEGKVNTESSVSEIQLQGLKNYLNPIEPTIVLFKDQVGLIAGVSENKTINYEYDQENFALLSKKYEIVQFEAVFTTNFKTSYTSGNYGIKLKFKTGVEDNPESYKEYVLDSDNFTGNAYGFKSGALQKIQFSIPANTLKSLDSIEFYQAMTQDQDSNNNPIDQENIFVKNIRLTFFEKLDFTEYEYYLKVQPKNGYIITNTVLSFEPMLLRKGQNVINETSYQIYWYIKEALTSSVENGIKTYAGNNWKLITSSDQTQSQYLENKWLFINSIGDVANASFKLIVKDDNDFLMEKEFEITNSSINLPKIQQNTLQNGDIELYLLDKDKIYIPVWEYKGIKTEGTDKKLILTKDKFLETFLQITCHFYLDGQYKGKSNYLLNFTTEEKDLDVTFEGIDYYQYDTNGDMYLEDAAREKLLKVNIQSKEGYMAQIESIKFYLNEHEISKEKTNESYSDSMLKEVWVDSENYIHYILQPTYSLSRNKNVIKVQISLVSGQELIFTKELIFNKIGNIGTNNSNYAISLEAANNLVAYNNFNDENGYGIKLKIYYQGKEMSPTEIQGAQVIVKDLKVNDKYVYQNQEFYEIFDTNNKYIVPKSYLNEVKEIFDYNYEKYRNANQIVSLEDTQTGLLKYYEARQTIESSDQQLTDSNGQINSNYSKYWRLIEDERSIFGGNYIIITISINNNIISSYLPIPVSRSSNINKEKNTIYLSNLMLPQTIRYSSQGDRPQYYNNSTSQESKISSYISIPNSFKPAYEFDFEQLNNNDKYYLAEIIQITTPSKDIIYWPVIYYLNTYGNSAINNWSGEEMEVDGGSILANQIIAGRKESGTNRFTGIALGEVEDEEVIYSGMYGYNNGINTFGLRSDGTAYFGMGKNIQINGEGQTAIQVGDIEVENNEIQGNGFLVDFNGNVYLSGTIYATEGNIGGWNITDDGLEAYRQWENSNKETAILLHPDNVQLPEVCIYHSGYGEESRGYLGFEFGNNMQPVLSLKTLTNGIYLNPYYEDTNENGYIRFSSEAIGFDRGKDDSSAQEMAKHIYLGKGSGGKTLHDYIEDMITTAINNLPIGGDFEE